MIIPPIVNIFCLTSLLKFILSDQADLNFVFLWPLGQHFCQCWATISSPKRNRTGVLTPRLSFVQVTIFPLGGKRSQKRPKRSQKATENGSPKKFLFNPFFAVNVRSSAQTLLFKEIISFSVARWRRVGVKELKFRDHSSRLGFTEH